MNKLKTSSHGYTFVWADIAPDEEAEFNHWYNTEHVSDRVLHLHGYISGRRFMAIDGGPKYIAVYRTIDLNIFSSSAYLELQSHPDPKSEYFIPMFRNVTKSFCQITWEFGAAEGGSLALLAVNFPKNELAQTMRSLLIENLEKVCEIPDIVSARLIETDWDVVKVVTAKFLRKTDRYIDAAILIEGIHVQALQKVMNQWIIPACQQWPNSMPDSKPTYFNHLISFHSPIP